ncbi:MAG: ATP synthase F1 subunit gamma [Candidatus Liptonbacteria bacterium]|nr:ATP synthase F1 subunit gamma [Candidatus Liptonbacteria bacterium]
MESLQNIKRRAKSVKNIGQITKAMELVAATKMRRSQEIALASRPYAFASLDFLANLARLHQNYGGQARLGDIEIPPLLQKREIRKTALVLVTSDKGLAGSFNSAVIRDFEKFLKQEKTLSPNPSTLNPVFISVGQKAANYLQKRFTLAHKFLRAGDFTTIEEVKPIAELLVSGYLEKKWDSVIVFSTHFRSALRQEPLRRVALPVDFESIKKTAEEIIPQTGRFSEFKQSSVISHQSSVDYLIEPSPEAVLNELVPHLVTMQIYHLILEANASEHAARRLAMKNASDNADDLGSKLNLEYNKSRQASITREIIEITSGVESLR